MCSDKIYAVRGPVSEIALVCRLFGSSVAYSYHIVLVDKKKDSQKRLASTISALLDKTLKDDDAQQISGVRSASGELKV